jgi:hypothetical protein
MSNGNPIVAEEEAERVRTIFRRTSDDPLAAFQQLKTASELENLHDIAAAIEDWRMLCWTDLVLEHHLADVEPVAQKTSW